jgi:hypothetical protein
MNPMSVQSHPERPTHPNKLAGVVDRVFVGQASRDDANNRTRRTIREEACCLQEEINTLVSTKTKLQNELSGINNEIRGNKLPRERYQSLCQRQHAISENMTEIENQIAPKRIQLRRLADEEDSYNDDMKSAQLVVLQQILAELRAIRQSKSLG